jgi:hypothetical protein
MGNFDCSFCGAEEGEPCRSRACQEAAKLRAEVERLKAFAAERDDSAGNRAAAKAEDERDVALLQVRALVTALERISQSSVDVVARGWADAALGYTGKRAGEHTCAPGVGCEVCGDIARHGLTGE